MTEQERAALRFTRVCLMNEYGKVVGQSKCEATLLPNGTVDYAGELAIAADGPAEASWLLLLEEPPGTKQLVVSINGRPWRFEPGDVFHLVMAK